MSGARFPLRRSRWGWLFLVPRSHVEVDSVAVRVRMGWLGRADIPLSVIDGLARMTWPVWGGLGVRLGGRMVGFVSATGPAVLIRMSERVPMRAPLRWRADRVVVAVEDVDGLMEAIDQRRGVMLGE